MTNYKPSSIQFINVAGVQVPIHAHDVIRNLYDQTDGSNTADTFQLNLANYKVPSGKTFHLVGIKITHNATAAGLAIWEGTGLNDLTTLRWTIFTPNYAATQEHFVGDIICGANEQYMTLKPSTGGVEITQLIGYETLN